MISHLTQWRPPLPPPLTWAIGTCPLSVADSAARFVYVCSCVCVHVCVLTDPSHFDCAWIYGNQKEIGRAFHRAIAESKVKREDLFVTSKVPRPFVHTRVHVVVCVRVRVWGSVGCVCVRGNVRVSVLCVYATSLTVP